MIFTKGPPSVRFCHARCRPNLDPDRIGACPNEGLYLQVLLEGFEKQFNLPAFSVNGGNRAGCELQLVSEQLDFTLVALIPDESAKKSGVKPPCALAPAFVVVT